MSRALNRVIFSACLVLLPALLVPASAAKAPILVDRILAIVNDEVITARELGNRLRLVESELRRQGTALPATDVLERQVLERIVIDRLQLQQARETGIRIDDQQLDQAIQRIAAGNKVSLQQFREMLERDGVVYVKFRDDIREEMTIGRLREREVDQRLQISEGEVDAFIENEAREGAARDEYALAHILVRVPESAGPEVIAEKKARAEEARNKLLAGEDFAKVAAAYSDAQDALQGGRLGARTLDRLPSLYAGAASGMKIGDLSALLRSPNGFHLIKLESRKTAAEATKVQQTHVRHILIRTSEAVSEAEVRQKLLGVRERLVNGGSFVELSRLYSQDGSAAKGGDLGWIYPGDTVPDFERAMDALKPGELSQPVQSPFGWHLIEVIERRIDEPSLDRKRLMARGALRERKSGEAYQDWIRQLRDRAYVEFRLDEK